MKWIARKVRLPPVHYRPGNLTPEGGRHALEMSALLPTVSQFLNSPSFSQLFLSVLPLSRPGSTNLAYFLAFLLLPLLISAEQQRITVKPEVKARF